MVKRESEKSHAREAFELAQARRAQLRSQLRRSQFSSAAMRPNKHRGRG